MCVILHMFRKIFYQILSKASSFRKSDFIMLVTIILLALVLFGRTIDFAMRGYSYHDSYQMINSLKHNEKSCEI